MIDAPICKDNTIQIIEECIDILDIFLKKVNQEQWILIKASQIKFYLSGYKDCYLKDGDTLLGMVNAVKKYIKVEV
jgi:hypothetical protein